MDAGDAVAVARVAAPRQSAAPVVRAAAEDTTEEVTTEGRPTTERRFTVDRHAPLAPPGMQRRFLTAMRCASLLSTVLQTSS